MVRRTGTVVEKEQTCLHQHTTHQVILVEHLMQVAHEHVENATGPEQTTKLLLRKEISP